MDFVGINRFENFVKENGVLNIPLQIFFFISCAQSLKWEIRQNINGNPLNLITVYFDETYIFCGYSIYINYKQNKKNIHSLIQEKQIRLSCKYAISL